MQTVANDATAHDLLRRAHARGYRFPENFKGFRAKIVFHKDAEQVTGTVEVTSPREVTLHLETATENKQWAQREIASMAGHRWYSRFEESDGRYTLTLGPDDNHLRGRQILIHDDAFHSSYRVLNDAIIQINRTMGQAQFTINIQEHVILADNQRLPGHFTVTYWDTEQKRLTRTDIYSDRYRDVDGIYCPAMRRVITADDSGLVARRIELSEHVLLGEKLTQ